MYYNMCWVVLNDDNKEIVGDTNFYPIIVSYVP